MKAAVIVIEFQIRVFISQITEIMKQNIIGMEFWHSVHGFPNNLQTYGMVSGLWTSTFALGAFVGPSAAGILFDNFGFRASTDFVIIINLLLVTIETFSIGHKFSHRCYLIAI